MVEVALRCVALLYGEVMRYGAVRCGAVDCWRLMPCCLDALDSYCMPEAIRQTDKVLAYKQR